MGNDHSRKPLLPIFKHLEEVSIEELQAVYTRYRYKFKSPPFLTRQQYSAIFFDEDKPKPAIDPNETENEASIRKHKERIQKISMRKQKTDPLADLQFAYLDRFKRQRISAIDIFAGLSLICHESMDGRLKFAFSLVDFGRLNKINHAELTLMISAALRGIARFKGIKDAPMYEADTIARRVFLQSEVNLRAGEGVGDYKEGGVTLKHVVAFCRKDVKARALLDNIDAGAYLSGLLKQHQDMFDELIDIEGAIQMKREREKVDKGVQKIASEQMEPPLMITNKNETQLILNDAVTQHVPPGITLKSKRKAAEAYSAFGVYSPQVVTSLEHFRVSMLPQDSSYSGDENDTVIANIGLSLVAERNTSIVPYDPEQKLEGDPNVHKFQTEEDIQDSFNDQEAMGVWKVMKNDEKGRKVYQHLITGEIVPNIPPYDSRDAERVLENKATKYIVDSVGVRDRERKRKYLDNQANTWWVSADDFYACTFAAGLRLRKVESEKALQNLTSKIPPQQLLHVVPGILNETTNMVEKCSDSTTVSGGSTLPLPTGDQDVATGETIKEGDDKNSENEEDDEDEDNKIYFGKFREWLQRETLKTIRMREMEVSKALKDSLKRRLDRNRMILKRRMRRFIKGQQLEEEQRILAEEAAARLREENGEDLDDELEEDDEFKNLSDIEKANRRAHHRWSKVRIQPDNFVLPTKSRHALDDMLAGYSVQGALDLAEERKGMLTADKMSRSKNVMEEFERMLSSVGIDMPKANVDYEQQQKLMEEEESKFEGMSAEEVMEKQQKLKEEKHKQYLEELQRLKREPWEEDSDDEDDERKVAKFLDFNMSLPLERRAVWMQMEMQRRALAYVKWSLDQSGINRWRRRYQRMGLGWEDYLAEFEAENTTRHQEDDQGDFTNGPRKWSLTAQIDPPYKIFHIPHYGKKDIDDPDNDLVSESEEDGSDNDDNMDDIKEGAYDSEDSESDEDDLPPPPPKPKLVIEIDINRGNPDAMGILDQMDKHQSDPLVGDDGTYDLLLERNRRRNRSLFSLRTLLMRAYGKKRVAHDTQHETGKRKTEDDKIKHFQEYSASMEENDLDDELEESDMIDNRRACFYIEIKCTKSAKVKDVHLIAESIAAFLEIPIVTKCYSSFAHSPLVERVSSYGEVCIRISFLLYNDADPFIAIARMLGLKVDEMFSEELPTGVPGSFNAKKRGADNGGIQLFNIRAEINVDVGEAFDLTLPFVDHHSNTVKWEKESANGPLVPVLSGLAKQCVLAIHKYFDEDKDKALSFKEINKLNLACRNPLFESPKEYQDSIAEDKFDAKVADAGIGLTIKGLQQAYAAGEGDLGRDMALLNMGSLSHYVKGTVYANFDCTESFGRRLMYPNGAPILPGSSNSIMQKYFAMLIRYVRESRATMRFPGIFKLMHRYFDCSYKLREEDGSAKSMDSFKEWLVWLFGHPGAFASFILSIRQTIVNDVALMRKFIQRAEAEGWEEEEEEVNDAEADIYAINKEQRKQESAENLEAKAERGDCLDAARILTRLYELCKDNVDELTSIVFVSEDLSLRTVISGFDIIRFFYDLPAKVPEETPQEKAYRQKKEQKRMRKERDKAAIAAIRAKKQQAQSAKKKSVTFANQ